MRPRPLPLGRGLYFEQYLGVPTLNALRRAGLGRLGDLLQLTRSELLKMPGIGRVAVKEIEETLAEDGLHLREEGTHPF